jgi:hypothetical protein
MEKVIEVEDKIFTNSDKEIEILVKKELDKKKISDLKFKEKLINDTKDNINRKIDLHKKERTIPKEKIITDPNKIDWKKLSWAYQNI